MSGARWDWGLQYTHPRGKFTGYKMSGASETDDIHTSRDDAHKKLSQVEGTLIPDTLYKWKHHHLYIFGVFFVEMTNMRFVVSTIILSLFLNYSWIIPDTYILYLPLIHTYNKEEKMFTGEPGALYCQQKLLWMRQSWRYIKCLQPKWFDSIAVSVV